MSAWKNICQRLGNRTLRLRLIVYGWLFIWANSRGNFGIEAYWLSKAIDLYPEDSDARNWFEEMKTKAERKARLQDEAKLKPISKEIRFFDDTLSAAANRAHRSNRDQSDDRRPHDRSASNLSWSRLRRVGAWWRTARFLMFMEMAQRAKRRHKPSSAAYWLKKCTQLVSVEDSPAVVTKVLYDDLARALTEAGRHDEAEEASKLARKAQREMDGE